MAGKRYRRWGKRALDLAVAVPAAVVLAPLGVAVAGVVRASLGSPVLFRQQRPGRAGEPFQLFKFRTMTDASDSRGVPLADGQRLTSVGRALRRLSLDELPQLLNVIRGEMSLVGPRPLLMEYLDRYTAEQARRHEVTPGITGWAQVHGRNSVTWRERFAHDVWYVDHQSLRLDLHILWLTLGRVLGRDGVSAPGHETMPTFTGTEEE